MSKTKTSTILASLVVDRASHAALEEPELLVDDVRTFLRDLR